MEYCIIDEMPQNAIFYQDLHKLQVYLEISNVTPLFTMDHPKLIVSNE